tara:strand:- start:1022 stop:1285 length:264 start_codon:yes stop_codon:yes gene_type:complete
MYKFVDIIIFIFIIFFIFIVYSYYSSNKNINKKNFNRSNIDQILKEKIIDLPVLENDTNNVIEFNNSLENEINNIKKRSFWNLLKNK